MKFKGHHNARTFTFTYERISKIIISLLILFIHENVKEKQFSLSKLRGDSHLGNKHVLYRLKEMRLYQFSENEQQHHDPTCVIHLQIHFRHQGQLELHENSHTGICHQNY